MMVSSHQQLCLAPFGFDGRCFKVSAREVGGALFALREGKLGSCSKFLTEKSERLKILAELKGNWVEL